jgi:hypothetical protein
MEIFKRSFSGQEDSKSKKENLENKRGIKFSGLKTTVF